MNMVVWQWMSCFGIEGFKLMQMEMERCFTVVRS